MTPEQLGSLFVSSRHPPLVRDYRARLLLSRVRAVALLFSALTAMWIVIDWLVFPPQLWKALALGRLVVSASFLVLAVKVPNSRSIKHGFAALAMLMAIPTVFYLYSHAALRGHDLDGLATVLVAAYAFVPFVMVAGLAIFPLTALEGLVLSSAVVFSVAAATSLHLNVLQWGNYLAVIWLLMLIAVVATFACMSQLLFIIALVKQTTRDHLTGSYTRHGGEDLLRMLFLQARRSAAPLSVIFIDLDRFKSVNDTHGHEAGDQILRQAARHITEVIRRNDVLIRWGGEEFVLVLPQTGMLGARAIVRRLRYSGLGLRPDNTPLTASMGVAIDTIDPCDSHEALVELADQRMYGAKQGGRDRAVLPQDQVIATPRRMQTETGDCSPPACP